MLRVGIGSIALDRRPWKRYISRPMPKVRQFETLLVNPNHPSGTPIDFEFRDAAGCAASSSFLALATVCTDLSKRSFLLEHQEAFNPLETPGLYAGSI